MAVFVLAQTAVGCASVPVAATKGANSPASPEASEGRLEPLDLFPSSAALNPPMPTASPTPAMPGMDHSHLDHSAPAIEEGSKTTTQPAPAAVGNPLDATYTCVMHPHIAESKPGKCPICGMPLVKKEKK